MRPEAYVATRAAQIIKGEGQASGRNGRFINQKRTKPRSLQRNATRGAFARHAGLALRQHQCSCCGRALAVRRSALSLGFRV